MREVLVADDDELLLASARRSLGLDYIVHTATSPAEALRIANDQKPEVAIIDLRLGSESGIELVRELRRGLPRLSIALCSAYLSVDIAVAAVRAGAEVVVFKPITFKEILRDLAEPRAEDPQLDDTPTLARVEWEHISRVLADCNGNISLAARRLGIYRSSLQRKLRKYAPRS